jgi:hypothetical protein
MRDFFLCLIFFLGLFWVIDIFAFEGQNSAGTLEEARRLGQKFSSEISDQVGRIWR